MHGTYIGNDLMLIKTVYNGMLLISANDRGIMPMLATTGALEPPLTKYFINQIKPKGTVVDIGSNIGYFTLLAAMLVGDNGMVIGYEASPDIYQTVKENIEMNWVEKQTTLYNKAVYSRNQMITFYYSEQFQGYSSIKQVSKYIDNPERFSTVEVEAVKLDDELQHIEQIDLLKMDIEGGEYHALLGMMSLIRQNKIKQIIFEWNISALGKEAEALHMLLTRMQMEFKCIFYTIDGEGNLQLLDVDILMQVEFYPYVVIKF